MSTIQAKPTIYRDTRFRSRLEARWARFFDAVGREWIYEPDVPELKPMQYQPDFLIDGIYGGLTLVEVKPMVDSAVTAKELGDEKWRQVADLIKGSFVLLMGAPGEWMEGHLTGHGHVAFHYHPSRNPTFSQWAECRQCEAVAIWEDGIARCHSEPPSGPLLRAYQAVRDESWRSA